MFYKPPFERSSPTVVWDLGLIQRCVFVLQKIVESTVTAIRRVKHELNGNNVITSVSSRQICQLIITLKPSSDLGEIYPNDY